MVRQRTERSDLRSATLKAAKLRRVKDEYGKYYYVDLTTNNGSFLITSQDLAVLGIENNFFFLKLYDPDLVGVDPHDPDLPKEYALKVVRESMRNIWYFLRECVRIPEQGGTSTSFMLHRGNLAMVYCFINSIDNYLSLPRQKGKTQSIVSVLNWVYTIGTTNSATQLYSKDPQHCQTNLGRMKTQLELLPSYFRIRERKTEEGKIVKEIKNSTKLGHVMNGNFVMTSGSTKTPQQANSVGRGESTPIQYYDEFEFMPNNTMVVRTSGPAHMTAARNAESNKAPHCRMFSSTAGDLDSPEGVTAANFISNMVEWSDKFYDLEINELKELIKKTSESRIVFIEYQYNQLGEGQAWFIEQCRLLENNAIDIKREILLQRINGSNKFPYDVGALDNLLQVPVEVHDEIFINKFYKFVLYEPLVLDHIYFVGVDIASNFGEDRDSTAIVIIDAYTDKIVGEFESNVIPPVDVAELVITLVSKFIPLSIIVPERNTAATFIDIILRSPVAPRLYHTEELDLIGNSTTAKLDAQQMLVHKASQRRHYGIQTTPSNRPAMFGILEESLLLTPEILNGKMVRRDLSKLVTKNGKPVAGPGAHDDVLMAYNVARYAMVYAKNLFKWGYHRGMRFMNERRKAEEMSAQDFLNQMSDEERKLFQGVAVRDVEDEDRRMKRLMHDHYQKAIMDGYRSVDDDESENITQTNLETIDYSNHQATSNTRDLSIFDELNNQSSSWNDDDDGDNNGGWY